ncbi:orotate phosphoribosyltransferase [Bosea sp. 124]|uniref:orotate phosphoribosyltransferase n=1 Tax=Bosea sp. 124 TaxID=2135642 RepID=UPI000D3B3539|nr:orotate phosphoribosyltransferase [Bosea sp. 124]PTM43648.1 orotate phosphoribosyltransferase [Bosea sp. 124]
MTDDDVLAEFRDAGALLEGHFILSSGRRSAVFLQKMFVFQDPVRTERLCKALAAKIEAQFGQIDYVVSPAVGGIVPGYETARHLKAKAVFVEREGGVFKLRRGFTLPAGARCIIIEDIITTGLSLRECRDSVLGEPGTILGAACLIDRSAGRAELGMKLVSLMEFDVPDYAPEGVPPELAAIPPIKPGSRGLTA